MTYLELHYIVILIGASTDGFNNHIYYALFTLLKRTCVGITRWNFAISFHIELKERKGSIGIQKGVFWKRYLIRVRLQMRTNLSTTYQNPNTKQVI